MRIIITLGVIAALFLSCFITYTFAQLKVIEHEKNYHMPIREENMFKEK